MQRLFVILAVFATCHSIDLPCDFVFNKTSGYSCKVVNFTNTNRHAYITRVTGNHLHQDDKNYRNRSHSSVSRVSMWNAAIHYIPGNLTEVFPLLRILQVKKCDMKGLTRSTEFQGLRQIYFGFNEIDRIPVNHFWHYCKLEILSLFGNRISHIPRMAFRDLISLRKLSLKSNRLRELDPLLFGNCTQLEFVDLDHNLLENVDGRLFSNHPKLVKIYFRHNNIVSIENYFLSNLPRIELAMFQGNPCINASYPDINLDSLSGPKAMAPALHEAKKTLEFIQKIFRDDCSPPVPERTTKKPRTTTKPRKKPKIKYMPPYYFDNCEWHTPRTHRYF